MSESGPEPFAVTLVKRPARHGVIWAKEEVESLVDEIQQGLSLSELAELHQRTPAGITGAVMRLMPSILRPDNNDSSVDLLAQYLREQNDTDKQQLIAKFRPSRSAPAKTKLSKPPQDPEIWPKIEPRDELLGIADVGMLVTVAVSCMPESRDCEVLEMRLGMDGQPLTLAEIGKKYGLSRERVRQIQERALRKLARRSRDQGAPGHILKSLLVPFGSDEKALVSWLLEAAECGFEIPPRFAVKFILRAAGYTKAKEEEVSALLPVPIRPRKAKQSDAARIRIPIPVKPKIEKWLEHADWPDVVCPPPPATQLSAHRVVNDSDIAGNFYSQKLDRVVHFESNLEFEIFTELENCEQIAYYQEQPAKIPYAFKGRQRKYFPDILAITTDGRGLLIEVKPTDNMALSVNRAKAAAGRAWAHARGWGWLVMNNRHTLREIEERVLSEEKRALLENELKMHGVLTWLDQLRLRIEQALTRLDFTTYIIQSGAHLDRAYRMAANDISLRGHMAKDT